MKYSIISFPCTANNNIIGHIAEYGSSLKDCFSIIIALCVYLGYVGRILLHSDFLNDTFKSKKRLHFKAGRLIKARPVWIFRVNLNVSGEKKIESQTMQCSREAIKDEKPREILQSSCRLRVL